MTTRHCSWKNCQVPFTSVHMHIYNPSWLYHCQCLYMHTPFLITSAHMCIHCPYHTCHIELHCSTHASWHFFTSGGYPPLPHLAPTTCVFMPEHWKPLTSCALLPLCNNCQSLKALCQLHILITTVNWLYLLTIILHHLCQPPCHPLSSHQTPILMTIMHISL